MMPGMAFEYNDGGRGAAGFRGDTGDCGVRAIAIATGYDYRDVYDSLFARAGKGKSPREGVSMNVMNWYLTEVGWAWVPVMHIGTGCTMHLRSSELPDGAVITRLSRHYAAVIDGVLHDTYDCSREGTRCVYGYWNKEATP